MNQYFYYVSSSFSAKKMGLYFFKYLLAVSFSSLCVVVPVFAGSFDKMLDPILGLTYKTKNVVFDFAPEEIRQLCSDIRDMPKIWVFAQSEFKGSKYFLLSGYLNMSPDTQKLKNLNSIAKVDHVEIDELGFVVELRGKDCRLIVAQGVMNGDFALLGEGNNHPVRINTTVIDLLYADAARRYLKAFGGKETFINELKKHKLDPEDHEPPGVLLIKKYFPDAIFLKH